MHLTVINCSPRVKSKSNTEIILEHFLRGFEESGNTSEVWHLSDKNEWESAAKAFYGGTDILFALPLFVENIPGVMLEFLEHLTPKAESGTRISFILQGGFPEAAQLRCGEKFLKSLPEKLGCALGGVLIKGNMFGMRLVPEEMAAPQLEEFVGAGRHFAENGGFTEDFAQKFGGPEHFPKSEIVKFRLFGKIMQRIYMPKIAAGMGCTKKLTYKPYK